LNTLATLLNLEYIYNGQSYVGFLDKWFASTSDYDVYHFDFNTYGHITHKIFFQGSTTIRLAQDAKKWVHHYTPWKVWNAMVRKSNYIGDTRLGFDLSPLVLELSYHDLHDAASVSRHIISWKKYKLKIAVSGVPRLNSLHTCSDVHPTPERVSSTSTHPSLRKRVAWLICKPPPGLTQSILTSLVQDIYKDKIVTCHHAPQYGVLHAHITEGDYLVGSDKIHVKLEDQTSAVWKDLLYAYRQVSSLNAQANAQEAVVYYSVRSLNFLPYPLNHDAFRSNFIESLFAIAMDFTGTFRYSCRTFSQDAHGSVLFIKCVEHFGQSDRGQFFIQHVRQNKVAVARSFYEKLPNDSQAELVGVVGLNDSGFELVLVEDDEIPPFVDSHIHYEISETITESAFVEACMLKHKEGKGSEHWSVNTKKRISVSNANLLKYCCYQLRYHVNIPSLVYGNDNEAMIFNDEDWREILGQCFGKDAKPRHYELDIPFRFYVFKGEGTIKWDLQPGTRFVILFEKDVETAVKFLHAVYLTCRYKRENSNIVYDYGVSLYPIIHTMISGVVVGKVHSVYSRHRPTDSAAKRWFSKTKYFKQAISLWEDGKHYTPNLRNYKGNDVTYEGRRPGIYVTDLTRQDISSITCAIKSVMFVVSARADHDSHSVLFGGSGAKPPVLDAKQCNKTAYCVEVDRLNKPRSLPNQIVFEGTVKSILEIDSLVKYSVITLFNFMSLKNDYNDCTMSGVRHIIELSRRRLSSSGTIIFNYISPYCDGVYFVYDDKITIENKEDEKDPDLREIKMTIESGGSYKTYVDLVSKSMWQHLVTNTHQYRRWTLQNIVDIGCKRYNLENISKANDIMTIWGWFSTGKEICEF
jgi:hypothetical protein